MQKFALALVFFSSGCKPLLAYLYSLGMPDLLPYPNLVLCIPALLLGLESWCRVNSFARSWPVLACLSVMFAGIFWVDPTERGRAMLVFAGVASSVPIAALIVETRSCRFCAQAFIGVAFFNFLLLVHLQGMFPAGGRFGNLILNDVRICDPNELAAQLGIAAILSISLMQKKGKNWANRLIHRSRGDEETILWLTLIVFTIGILLTASRSGILSLFAVLGLFVISCNTKAIHRIAIFSVGILAVLTIFSTENRISTRFQDAEGLAVLGHRLPIWETGIWILKSDRNYLAYGIGTGGIDKALAEFSLYDDTFRRGSDDILRRASHNAYLEWLVSYGLLGVPLGCWLLMAGIRLARKLDKFDKSFSRCSLLSYCAIVSLATELYRLSLATGLCALAIAMLSGPFLMPWPPRKPRSQNQHAMVARAPVRGTRRPNRLQRTPRTFQ